MNKEEFYEKMNRKNLGEIAEEQILAFCSSDCTVRELLFGGVDERIIGQEDMALIRGVLSISLKTLEEDVESKDPVSNPAPVKTIVQLKYILHEASEAMNTAFMRLLHSMREEKDYSGIGMIYDACTVDQPFEIYQRLGDMIFNDHFSELDLEERAKISPLFKFYFQHFDKFYGDLIQAAESAWESYQNAHDDESDDNNSEKIELTFERFQEMIANADVEVDLPSLTAIHKRLLQASAYLMALSAAADEYCADLKRELCHDDGELNYILDLISAVPDVSAKDFGAWYERFVTNSDDVTNKSGEQK